MIIEAWRDAERVHIPGCNAHYLREERGRVSVQVTEIKDPMKQGVLKIACITLTHLYVYIHKEIYESNLTKILSYLRVMAFQVSH